jgi:hypothetical protein
MAVGRYSVWCVAIAFFAWGAGTLEKSTKLPVNQTESHRSSPTPTLDGVRRKGFVQCGVTTGVAGFSTPDAQGQAIDGNLRSELLSS